MANNYTATAPSPALTIVNGSDPSGFKLVGVNVDDEISQEEIPSLVENIVKIGVPVLAIALSYFTMSAIGAGVIVQEVTDGTAALTLNSTALDNLYMVGMDLRFQADGRGIVSCLYTQQFLHLGQRVTYGP